MTDGTRDTLRNRLRKHHEAILLGAILLIALALRLYGLERSSLWLDELMQIQAARPPWWRVPKAALPYPGSTPLDYLVTHFVYYYIGRSEGILRLPAVLWGVLTVAAVYFLGKRMFDKTTGFLAAAILTILPSHVYYSQEVRPYSLPALMIVLTTFAFYRALQRNTRGAWALYGATLAVGMYAHYYVAVVGILHGVYLVLMALAKRLPWNRLLPYVIAAGIAGLLFLPWVLADDFNAGRAFKWPPISVVISAAFVPGDPRDVLIAQPGPLGAFVCFAWLCVAASLIMGISRSGSDAQKNVALLAIVSLTGMAASLLLDLRGGHFFPPRHFLPYAPCSLLLIAVGAMALVRVALRWLGTSGVDGGLTILAVVCLVAFVRGTLGGSLARAYQYEKQDWRGVGRYLLQHVKPEDAIVLRAPYDVTLYAPELVAQTVPLRNKNTIFNAARTHPRV